MRPLHTEQTTNVLGQPDNWEGAPMTGLPVCASHVPVEGQPGKAYVAMTSWWRPTAEELASLNKGASIAIQLITPAHPPIVVFVDEAVIQYVDPNA